MLLDHFGRIEAGANAVYNLANLSRYIEEKTFLNDRPFSFLDHEFQRTIIDDACKELFVIKCAQVGLSEIFARWGISAVATQQNFTLIWTFPKANDAELFCKARLNPFISSSKELKRMLNADVDSNELKQFGRNSFVYIRGTVSETGALSVPADLLIHDEYDRSDLNNISAYVSRLQHKPTKTRRIFSTPTVAKYGIDQLSRVSRRMKQMWKCSHCNNHWLPSFDNDIIIPGWNRPKQEINKTNIKDVDLTSVYMACPKCGLVPDPGIQYREWVMENPNENYGAKSYFVSPFCAPLILPPSYLVESIAKYDKWSEFVNQTLGLTCEDSSESLTEQNIRDRIMPMELASSEIHAMGIDMGVTCHVTIGRISHDGHLLVVHRERVNYKEIESKKAELAAKYRCVVTVMDMFPYTEIVTRVTEFDPNSYGAIYVDKNSTETHTLKVQDADADEGKLNVRTTIINRSVALDELMNRFKKGTIVVPEKEDKEEFIVQLQDMKRVQKFDKFGGIVYRWEKTKGNDHWHHSLNYMNIATKLMGTYTAIEETMPSLVSTDKVKQLTNRPLGLSILGTTRVTPK